MGIVHPGPKNPNWRGGRSIASNGYVLIRVGVGHPLADVRGYAYEHRIVAEQKLGRPIAKGEQVHHIDGDKQNNAPENLEVLSAAEHRVEHRGPRRFAMRLPGEPNPEIACECGCGVKFQRYDGSGRPRRFITGHNRNEAATQWSIADALRDGPLDLADLVRLGGGKRQSVCAAVSKMHARGVLRRVAPARWALASYAPGDTDILLTLSRSVADALLDVGVVATDDHRRIAGLLREVAALYETMQTDSEDAA